jgi:hypothetical protein
VAVEANVGGFLRDRARLVGWLFVACVIPSVVLLTAGAAPGVVFALVFLGSAVAAWRIDPGMLAEPKKRPVLAEIDEEVIYRANIALLRVYFRRLDFSREVAEDLIREVFIRFLEELKRRKDADRRDLLLIARRVSINEKLHQRAVSRAAPDVELDLNETKAEKRLRGELKPEGDLDGASTEGGGPLREN